MDTVVVVTTGQFTAGAEEVAEKLNVKLVAGPQLYELISALDAFELAQSYIGPHPSQVETAPVDDEANTIYASSRNADRIRDTQSIPEFGADMQIKDVPKQLSSLIKLRMDIVDDLQSVQSELDSAKKSLREEQYIDAVEKYKELDRQRTELQRKIAQYDAGLTYTDSTAVNRLPAAETFATDLAQITEGLSEQFEEAFCVAEQAEELDLLAAEVRDCVAIVEEHIEKGYMMFQIGEVEKSHSQYNQAKHCLKQAREVKEVYQDLIAALDNKVIESHQKPLGDVLLSEPETQIADGMDSRAEYVAAAQIAEKATGRFDPEVLFNYNAGLFDKDLLDYIRTDEELEFVFAPPRRGYKVISSDGIEDIPLRDASHSGSNLLLITNKRVLFVAGVDDHDETEDIDFGQISQVSASTDAATPGLRFAVADGTEYLFEGLREHTSDLDPAAKYVRSRIK